MFQYHQEIFCISTIFKYLGVAYAQIQSEETKPVCDSDSFSPPPGSAFKLLCPDSNPKTMRRFLLCPLSCGERFTKQGQLFHHRQQTHRRHRDLRNTLNIDICLMISFTVCQEIKSGDNEQNHSTAEIKRHKSVSTAHKHSAQWRQLQGELSVRHQACLSNSTAI